MSATKIPDFIYLITVDSEWPVSLIADNETVAASVEREVHRRASSGNVSHPGQVKVWKARLTDVVPVQLNPAKTVGPSLTEVPDD